MKETREVKPTSSRRQKAIESVSKTWKKTSRGKDPIKSSSYKQHRALTKSNMSARVTIEICHVDAKNNISTTKIIQKKK